MKPLLYIDTSAAIRIELGDHDGPELKKFVAAQRLSGVMLCSSRLLELECRRAAVRLEAEGFDSKEVATFAANCRLLPIDDDVWRTALGITQTVKSLDAIHLATCALVPNVRLLTSDITMRTVAKALGIVVAEP